MESLIPNELGMNENTIIPIVHERVEITFQRWRMFKQGGQFYFYKTQPDTVIKRFLIISKYDNDSCNSSGSPITMFFR